MKVTLVCVGKTDFSFVDEGVELYSGRLSHYCKFSVSYIPQLKGVGSLTKEQIKEREGELILRELHLADKNGKMLPKGKRTVVLLDERGKELTSRELASKIERASETDNELCFVIGGAYGFSDAVYGVADKKLSLSRMTFSHQIVRLLFMEQLYRAFTIIKGEPYHHD